MFGMKFDPKPDDVVCFLYHSGIYLGIVNDRPPILTSYHTETIRAETTRVMEIKTGTVVMVDNNKMFRLGHIIKDRKNRKESHYLKSSSLAEIKDFYYNDIKEGTIVLYKSDHTTISIGVVIDARYYHTSIRDIFSGEITGGERPYLISIGKAK